MQSVMSVNEWLQRNVPLRVADCLAYARMTDVPPSYDRFAGLDFESVRCRTPMARWSDYCPAYAFALLTHAAYAQFAIAAIDSELHSQWNELRGTSDLDWPSAMLIMRGAWRYLDSMRVN